MISCLPSPGRASPLVLSALLVTLVTAACTQSNPQQEDARNTVEPGKEVALEFTMKLDDGTVVDTNVGSEPLTYTQGSGQLVHGLEVALEGMAVGEQKQVTVSPGEGYGAVDLEQVQEVPKTLVAPDAREVGAQLQTRGPHGETLYVQVVEVKDETIVLDLNHPLAGKTLHFDVKVLDIKQRRPRPQP